MLKNKPKKLKMFKIDYSVSKNNKMVNGSVIIKSVKDSH